MRHASRALVVAAARGEGREGVRMLLIGQLVAVVAVAVVGVAAAAAVEQE